jgi:hypothetical protein
VPDVECVREKFRGVVPDVECVREKFRALPTQCVGGSVY